MGKLYLFSYENQVGMYIEGFNGGSLYQPPTEFETIESILENDLFCGHELISGLPEYLEGTLFEPLNGERMAKIVKLYCYSA